MIIGPAADSELEVKTINKGERLFPRLQQQLAVVTGGSRFLCKTCRMNSTGRTLTALQQLTFMKMQPKFTVH
jgi:transposase-like protein